MTNADDRVGKNDRGGHSLEKPVEIIAQCCCAYSRHLSNVLGMTSWRVAHCDVEPRGVD